MVSGTYRSRPPFGVVTWIHPHAQHAAEAAEAAAAQGLFWEMHDAIFERQTPTFLIDGVRHDESWDAETLTDALRRGSARQ